MAVSAIRAEFLFEKNLAADDKFLCLHKKLYRREKPAAASNPARLLSQMRLLQSILPPSTPGGIEGDLKVDYNGMFAYLYENNGFTSNTKAVNQYTAAMLEYINAFSSDSFKKIAVSTLKATYENLKASSGSVSPTSSELIEKFKQAVKARVDQMMLTYLMQYNIDQADADGISRGKILYVMLNILDLFTEDAKVARTAYEDAYSSNKDQIKNTDAMNSQAIIRWIESIRTRYAQLRAAPTPDTEQILEPYYAEGSAAIDTPSGNYLEPIQITPFERPADFEEPEPNPEVPVPNENLLIPDMIIEIQRTYNVQKMLMVYNQLPLAMRSDIDSCKLSLSGAFSRCEAAYGAGNCEPISRVAVHQKCPTGYLRQGCCKCVPECDPALYYTTARGFCMHKEDLHHVPALVAAASATNSQTVNSGINIAASACKTGFALNKFVCYRQCPAGTRAIGGATCLKNRPTILGSPFVWSAGDE
jgi:hypothetical protein